MAHDRYPQVAGKRNRRRCLSEEELGLRPEDRAEFEAVEVEDQRFTTLRQCLQALVEPIGAGQVELADQPEPDGAGLRSMLLHPELLVGRFPDHRVTRSVL